MLGKYWYIAAVSSDFRKKPVLKRTLLGQSILLFKKKNGALGAIENRCCHRNVELSLGRFENDCFTCGYHGWKFDSNGKCIEIPSLKTGIPKTARVKSFPVVERYGFLWVCLEPSEEKLPQDFFPELKVDPFIYTHHKFNGDLRFVCESLFDPYHINHVHKDSIKTLMGDLDSEAVDFNLTRTDTSLKGNYLRKNNSSVMEKAYFGNTEFIPTYFEFHFPNIAKLEMKFEKRTMTIYEHMVETEPGVIEMIQITTWKNIFSPFTRFARWFMKRKSEKIVQEDIAFFTSHARTNKSVDYSDVHIKSDKLSIEFRKLWDRNLGGN